MAYKFRSDRYVELSEIKGEIDNPHVGVQVGLRSGTSLPAADEKAQVTFNKSYVFKAPEGKKMYAKVSGVKAGTELDFEVADFISEGKGGEEVEELSEKLQSLSDFEEIIAVGGTYTIDFKSLSNKNAYIQIADTAAKTLELANVPTRAELFVDLKYSAECAITWPSGVSWKSGFAPEFYQGKSYYVSLMTRDSGATWYASYDGGWS